MRDLASKFTNYLGLLAPEPGQDTIGYFLLHNKCVVTLYIFMSLAVFGEPVGRVKIQMTSDSVQRYYTLKGLKRSNIYFLLNAEFSHC